MSNDLPAPMSDAPIFVVGFPRSGTTLAQSLIGAHPRIAAPLEMHYFSRVVMHRSCWGDLPTMSTCVAW